ncbi:hypothetical protein [Azospirillum sp. Sh1]|uniref:hypothetical protein n=1 Tax=Azospirillum sp. Sh1 TaxID=2607285 RepID=UPI0011EC5DE6|nr:hypothetical protein [Azospirillum sp. Sh1]KAA0573396.1 hypothetical protein FZ029_20680 [Azospirillum sp. Sh1]
MKFSVVGSKAFRDAHDAFAEASKAAAEGRELPPAETAEFETTALVNDFYRVHTLTVGEDGKLAVTGQFFARTIDDIFAGAGDRGLIRYERINVFPFRQPAERAPRAPRASRKLATAHG